MNWEDLKYFTYLVRGRTLDHAAFALKVDKATVSRRIKRLESTLGMTLFERNRRGFRMTPQGEKLYEKVETFDLKLSQIQTEEKSTPNALCGTIRISVAEGFGASIMTQLIATFHKAYSKVEIDLISGSGFLSLSRREADMAISLSKSNSKLIQSRPFMKYELGLYGHKDYPNIEAIQNIESLSEHSLIGYVDDLIYDPELNYFAEEFSNLKPTIRCSSLLAKRQLILNKAGLTILPSFLETPDMRRILQSEVKINRTFWLQTHQALINTDRIKAFKAHLEAEIQNIIF